MRQIGILFLTVVLSLVVFGCASGPQVKYVTEAASVVTEALEPVFIEADEMGNDIKAKLPKTVTRTDGGQSVREELEQVIQKNIKNTNKFKDVMVKLSSGDSYSIVPRIEEVSEFYTAVSGDPSRKRAGAKAKVHMDVFLYTKKGEKKLMASFRDEREKEVRVRSTDPKPDMRDIYLAAMKVAFASASDKLGSRFNPSYEGGEVTKVDGDMAYIRMNTSFFKNMPSKDQTVDILDKDNFKVAHVEAMDVKEEMVMGRMYKTAGKSVSAGMKTRARVNRLE